VFTAAFKSRLRATIPLLTSTVHITYELRDTVYRAGYVLMECHRPKGNATTCGPCRIVGAGAARVRFDTSFITQVACQWFTGVRQVTIKTFNCARGFTVNAIPGQSNSVGYFARSDWSDFATERWKMPQCLLLCTEDIGGMNKG
jgi:hypothetical protein